MINSSESEFDTCPHIDKLMCSRARELAPVKCYTERKCELYALRDKLFNDIGIVGSELTELNKILRE